MRDEYRLCEAEDDKNVSGCMDHWAYVHNICTSARAHGTQVFNRCKCSIACMLVERMHIDSSRCCGKSRRVYAWDIAIIPAETVVILRLIRDCDAI